MKTIKLKKNDRDPTHDAQGICDLIEKQFGVALCNRSATIPNDVHGYLETSSDGSISICLYEQKDVNEMNPTSFANLAITSFDDEEILKNLEQLLKDNTDLDLISLFERPKI